MLGSLVVRIGPANLPLWLILIAGTFILVAVAERFFFRQDREVWRRVNDSLITGAALFGIGWKLTPLATRFAEVTANLRILLYAPGGIAGVIVGATAAVVAVTVSLRKAVSDIESSKRPLILRYLLIAVVAVAFVPAVISVIPGRSSDQSEIPQLSLPSLDGSTMIQTSRLRPALLVFWATWCGPCSGEMGELQRVYEALGDEIDIVAINLTGTETSVTGVQRYIVERGYDFPVALDPTGSAYRSFEIVGTPTTIVVGADGKVRYRKVGAVGVSWMRSRLLPFVE